MCGMTLFILSIFILLLNMLQISSLLIWPFSPRAFRKFNVLLNYFFWSFCIFLMRQASRVEFIFSGDLTLPGENVILICNHQEMPDVLALTPLADRNGRLADLKWFAKDPIKYVPGVGWGLLFLDCIFLKRDWTKDASRIHQTFARILRHKSPFWLVSFSEGTRITPTKLQRSQDFSRRTGCPVLNHVLLPRTRGFVACVSELRSRIDAVYDVTLGYEPNVPTLWEFFKGRNRKVHLHVRRFPISALPTSQKDLAQWLIDRFVEKDQRMNQFQLDRTFS